MRVVLATVAVAAACTAVPAGAAIRPAACHARLAAAATGTSHSCETSIVGSTSDMTFYPRRLVTVEVTTGEATATLYCFAGFGREHTRTETVAAGATLVFSEPDDEVCRLTLTANVGGTTATATSSPAKGFNPY